MHANEWQTAFTIFYLRDKCPTIATLFTTHATGIGRSIAGNGKPLYDYFEHYNGDQMAAELNMVSKHSVEKQAAHWADCFTTVSDITARECAQLLDKPVDIVTPNGFEPDFVPKGKAFAARRKAAREALRRVAGQQLGGVVPEDAIMLCIAGRQEWKNKGIDVFLSAMDRLAQRLYHAGSTKQYVAFVTIPYLDRPFVRNGNVSIVFVPYYLDGKDPLLGKTYYDVLIGMDMTVFPSYYEPWGYTPLESVAFHVPTITTSLAGFGLWAAEQKMDALAPVQVLRRTDSNYDEVVNGIAESLFCFAQYSIEQVENMRKGAAAIAKKAEWKHFFKYYRKAYDIAIKKTIKRNKK
jgi:glycogen synthase